MSTGNQLMTYFAGNMIGTRLAMSLSFGAAGMYLSGFSTGLAALEGYNIAYERNRKDAKRKIFYSFVRLSLNTLCFLIDQPSFEGELKFKNYSFIAQIGGLLFGLAYGELYGLAQQTNASNSIVAAQS